MAACSIQDCGSNRRIRDGLCVKHYNRWKKDFEFAGQVLLDRQREHITALEKENEELKLYAGEKSNQYVAAMKENKHLRESAAFLLWYKDSGKNTDDCIEAWDALREAIRSPVDVTPEKIEAALAAAADGRRLASSERTEG